MSRTIDEKVVSMQFDNKHFESNVQTSISTLDKLKQSLNLSGASKGLENIDKAAKNVNMSGLGSAVETVRAKFSALEVMGVTTLANLTNSAVNAGKRIASALTIDPIMTGFSEYETKINAIQTIMSNTASKGTTMDDVTRVINDLNTYADKTIYNFAEMTKNIGTFTAAGVGLEESASAIKGISNLAAASGSTSQQASTAMYQLSQALASGTVKLMDWNSVVNAGMGGEKFQEALKVTAREHGIAVDDIIKKNGSFRDSLKEEWLSADILNETLQKFTVEGAKDYAKAMVDSGKYTREQADALIKEAQAMEDAATKVKTFTQLWDTLKESAQSGWAQSWEIIVGDFEEAKVLFTEISNVIGKVIGDSADARNKVLQGWKDLGGRTAIIDALRNAFEGIGSIITPISEAFREIFPPITAKQLASFSEALKNLTAKLKLSDEQSAKLKSTFKGLFAAIDIIRRAFVAVFNAIKPLFGAFLDLANGILGLTASWGEWVSNLRDGIKENKAFASTSKMVSDTLSRIINKIKELVNSDGLSNFMESVGKTLSSFGNKIKSVLSTIGSAFLDAFKNGDAESFMTILEGVLFSGILLKINSFIKKLSDSFSLKKIGILDSFKDILGNVSDVLDSVRGSLMAWQQNLKAGMLLKIAIAIGILALSIVTLSGIDESKITSSLGAITVLFIELAAAVKFISGVGSKLSGAGSVLVTCIGIAVAIKILSSALADISGIDSDRLETGVLAIAGLAGVLVASMKLLALGKSGSIQKTAASMVVFASAIKILASVCQTFSSMSWEDIGKGLAGVGGLLLEIELFINTAKFGKKTFSTALGITVLSASLKILASVCQTFSSMSWEDIGKGLAGVGGLLLEICTFTKLTGNANKVISTALSLTIIAGAMKLLVPSLQDLAQLSWDDITRGLVAIGGSLLILTMAAKAFPKKDILELSVSLPVVTSAIIPLAEGLTVLSKISWPDLVKSLIALGGTMMILAKGLDAMKSTLKGAGALLVASFAIVVLAGSISILSGIGIVGMITSLVSLAATFLILGAAAKFIAPLAGPLLKLSGSIIALGLSFTVLGIGLTAIGVGLVTIITNFVGAIAMLQFMRWEDIGKGLLAFAAIFAVIGIAAKLLKPLTISILSLSVSMLALGVACVSVGVAVYMVASALSVLAKMGPEAGASAAGALKEIIVGIVDILPSIISSLANTLKTLVLEIVNVVVDCAPALANGFLKVLLDILAALNEYVPSIIDQLMSLLIGIINGIAVRLPELIQAVFNLLTALFQGVIDALGNIDFNTLIKGIAGVGLMAGVMAALSAVASLTPMAMLGVLGMGAVIAELALVLAAIGALAQIPGLEWLISEGGQFMQTLGTAIGQFLGGIVGGFAQGMSAALPQIGSDLSAFMMNAMPFITGAKSFDSSAMDGVKALAGVILTLTATNVIDGIASWFTGGSSLVKFGEQLVPFGESMKAYSDAISGFNAEAVISSANAAKSLAELANNLPNNGGLVGIFAGENDIGTFGEQLIPFGKGMKAYSDAISGFNAEAVTASANAAKAIAEMTSYIPNSGGVVSWFAGDNSIAQFGEDLIALGEGLKGFSDAVVGVDPENLVAVAEASKVLVDMTNNVPNEGGVVSWFTGENSIAKFGEDLIALGEGLKGFSDAIVGVNPETITSAASAAKALAEMSNCIPNEGGVVSWFTGENSIAKFGEDLISLGEGLKGFADAIVGVDPESITAAASAANALAEMTNTIPNSGGVASWFAGEKSISKFGEDLIALGEGLKGFADSVEGTNPETLTAAAGAAKALAEMTSYIPNEGGIASWFTGEKSVSKFSTDLIALGEGLKGFADKVAGIDSESITAAASAAKSLAEMTSYIPNEGGIASWFTGEKSISKFGTDLIVLGESLKGFADKVAGIDSESMTAAANAAKTLAEMTSYIPNEGGIASWFAGEKSVSKFATDLISLGEGLKGFADKVAGINSESMTAAANNGKILAEMTNTIPNSGGVASWFAGEKSVSKFGTDLIALGEGLKGFADKVAGINSESMTAAANAGKTLAEMVNVIPNSGGVASWFAGEKSIAKFGTELIELGTSLKGFSDAVSGVNSESMTAAANAGKTLAEMTNTVPDNSDKLITFGENLKTFGSDLGSYFTTIGGISLQYTTMSSLVIDEINKVANISVGNVKSTAKAIGELVMAFKKMSSIKSDAASGFISALSTLAESSINDFTISFDDAITKMSNAGKDCVNSFVEAVQSGSSEFQKAGQKVITTFLDGINKQKNTIGTTFKTVIANCVSIINNHVSSFITAGAYLVSGFANGISSNTYLATAKARAMAAAAAQAAKDELDEHSPSRVFYDIGAFAGIALVNALGDYEFKANKAGGSLARASVDGLKNAISKVTDVINSDIDAQPTIRPVLDLSNVKSGADAIGGMLSGNRTLSVDMQSVGAISASMSRLQNRQGTNEVVSALKALRKDIANMPRNSYSVGDVSYDDGTAVSNAVQSLVRAVRVEGRV